MKQRLQTSGLYIANTSLELTDTDPNTVMVGVRALVCSQDTTRVPSSSEIFVNLTVVRPSWVEFCFTREENKISINFGASQDVNMINSVQIWTLE